MSGLNPSSMIQRRVEGNSVSERMNPMSERMNQRRLDMNSLSGRSEMTETEEDIDRLNTVSSSLGASTRLRPMNVINSSPPHSVDSSSPPHSGQVNFNSSPSPHSGQVNFNPSSSSPPHSRQVNVNSSSSSPPPHSRQVNVNSSSSSSPPHSRQVNGKPMNSCRDHVDDDEVEIGSLVEVTIDEIPRYGVIRWIGFLEDPNDSPGSGEMYEGEEEEEDHKVAGVELEEECPGCCDGTWNGRRYFSCQSKRGYFVLLSGCRKDGRFSWKESRGVEGKKSGVFGNIECPIVRGDVSPLRTSKDLAALCGKNRGIQGHHNSCYLDATLFAMFSWTRVFDSLLTRPPCRSDIGEYSEVQRVLKEEIVNPLRRNLYVRGDRVMHLRTLLEKLSSVRGLTSEEKDPEEFLNLLLNEILKADPYLKLSSGLETFFYQLFVEKDEKLLLPSVQQLFDQSFLASEIKLREIPPCLLIQMPRFGRQFKMYPRIIPTLYLDITDVVQGCPRQCCICGQVADLECKECFGQFGEGLESTAFCSKCLEKSHAHKKRTKHSITKLTVPPEYRGSKSLIHPHTGSPSIVFDPHTGSTSIESHTGSPSIESHTGSSSGTMSQVPRVFMELFAVLCIETSHYVAFVKCGTGPHAPWCFFDSMADRKGTCGFFSCFFLVFFLFTSSFLSVFLFLFSSVPILPLFTSDRNTNGCSC